MVSWRVRNDSVTQCMMAGSVAGTTARFCSHKRFSNKDSTMSRQLLLSTALTALLLGGCAVQPVPLGASRDDVMAHYGTPSRVVALPSGSRLQYSRQPAGQQAIMVDLDAAGRVVAVRQVLNPADFARVVPDQWTRGDIEREFGRPASIDHVATWSGDIMTYRWQDSTGFDMFFWVYLDAGNVVRRTGQGMEIRNRMRWWG